METTVCYVVSPNWSQYLYASINSLLGSGSQFDRIEVFSVGGGIKFVEKMKKARLNIVNKRSENFLGNKTYIGKVNSERVIFLDADTLVLGSIDDVYEGSEKDFIAKEASYYDKDKTNLEEWRKLLERKGSQKGGYYNSGFIIFQNGSQKEVSKHWFKLYNYMKNNKKTTKRIHDIGKEEQIALSLSVHKAGLSAKEMKDEEHVYGWIDPVVSSNKHERCTVYHTGSNRFWRYATRLARNDHVDISGQLGIDVSKKEFSKVRFMEEAYKIKYEFLGLG